MFFSVFTCQREPGPSFNFLPLPKIAKTLPVFGTRGTMHEISKCFGWTMYLSCVAIIFVYSAGGVLAGCLNMSFMGVVIATPGVLGIFVCNWVVAGSFYTKMVAIAKLGSMSNVFQKERAEELIYVATKQFVLSVLYATFVRF